MITGPYRDVLNAATMLGQSKTVFQSEIDIAELADFLRLAFGVHRRFLKISLRAVLVFGIAKTTGHWTAS